MQQEGENQVWNYTRVPLTPVPYWNKLFTFLISHLDAETSILISPIQFNTTDSALPEQNIIALPVEN